MTKRNDIVKFCEQFLETAKFQDYCHNGLQVEGAEEVQKIVTGVSLSEKFLDRAIEKGAQMVIVHHGLFKDLVGDPPQIRSFIKNRLKKILAADLNLCGFHLPLDAHPEIGNNISLIKLLGLENPVPMSDSIPGEVGFFGEFSQPMDFSDFVKMVEEKLPTKTFSIAAGPEKVKKVGVSSGGSSPDFYLVKEFGADTFLSGDVRESVVRGVEEVGINFVNGGHYNTEKLGIQNLGEKLAEKFDVEVEFVDIPCEA